MKLLLCIKQVPDMESRFKADAKGTWYSDTDLAWRMNEYDEYAVEEAVRLREAQGETCELTVLSIGTDRVGEVIKKALAMGADKAVHILDPQVSSKDPWQIASIIAAHAKEQNYDLIFTGMQSQDRGSAQVGVLLAEQLGYSCATTIIGFAHEGSTITVKRELEGGLKGVARLTLPAVVTCQLGLNIPRYPTLPNIMKAKKKEIIQIPVSDLLTEEALTTTTSFHPPAKKGGGIVLEGDVGELVDKVISILKDKTAVLR
jgi:electron transfer flavoprotein beta subunit